MCAAMLAAMCTLASGDTQGESNRQVMVWMANPYADPAKNQTIDTMIAALAPHRCQNSKSHLVREVPGSARPCAFSPPCSLSCRMGFTALAYQYFAICGEGSNDPGGSNDCDAADASGPPKLRKGHPPQVAADIGAQLTAGLGTGVRGTPLELWPVISYGNPGNASVLNALLSSPAAIDQFIADAIEVRDVSRWTHSRSGKRSTLTVC